MSDLPSTFQNMLTKLDKLTLRKNGEYLARCPAHEDDKPSLSLRLNGSKILVHCFAGCKPESIAAALGLSMADLSAGKGTPKKKAKRRIAKTYDYTDEDGKTLHQTVRFEPKNFSQRHLENNKWVWNLHCRRVLYHLPEIVKLEPGATVYLCEGEKSADAIRALGVVATTNAMGAGHWHKSYSETLRGLRVVILPDNDKAGIEHAQEVTRALYGTAASVHVLKLPDLESKGDPYDWVEAGGNLETLQELSANLPDAPIVEPVSNSGPYTIKGGRLGHTKTIEDKESGELKEVFIPIADFWARIVEEVTTEDGERSYTVQGRAVRGGPFDVEIGAGDFADNRTLKATLDAAAGARDPVHAEGVKHLGPAVKLCTGDDLRRIVRYQRTGWTKGQFLLPGRERDSQQIELPRKLPYSTTSGDLQKGMDALEALIHTMGPERTCVLLSFVMQGPAAALSDLRNERYALMVTGRTGALKTSTCQVAMSVWGHGFMRDENLIKWGEGATRNAMMALSVYARDLPLLLDNWKPNTGWGARDLVQLIHNILEGGEKDRLSRSAQLKESRPIYCWPLVTGEDVPDQDPATLARILVLPFAWQAGDDNPNLTKAQELAGHLPTVGAAWLDWLETEQGKLRAHEAGVMFPEYRAAWAANLRDVEPDAVNILRVASNLASNQLAYWLLRMHPQLGDLFDAYKENHTAGLGEIAGTMARRTARALEAQAYLAALRDLLASGEASLIGRKAEHPDSWDQRTFVGWDDGAGGVYLIPGTTRAKVERLIGTARLAGLSDQSLYDQLREIGAIASHTGDKSTKVIKVGPTGKTKSKRVLHIGAAYLREPGDSEDADAIPEPNPTFVDNNTPEKLAHAQEVLHEVLGT